MLTKKITFPTFGAIIFPSWLELSIECTEEEVELRLTTLI